MTRLLQRYAALWVPAFLAVTVTGAGAQTPAPEPSTYDRIWRSFTEIYRSDSNPAVQRVLFTGRFHQDFAIVDADQGHHNEANLRRLRLGPRVTLFKTVTAHVEFELNPQERNPTYVRLTDAYVQWSKRAPVVITVGKQSVPFTLDGATSSRELLTIDRSNIANNMWFPQEYMPGVSVSGRKTAWNYRAGVYSAGRSDREFGEFSGGNFALGVLGYDFAKKLGVREAVLTGNYVYQDADRRNTFTRQLEHVGSINFRFDLGAWGVRSDVTAANGYLGQSNLWGASVMPYVSLTRSLQAVGRYTYLSSIDPNGVLLGTYENRVTNRRGDRYNEIYGGLNYYFYAQRLKVQTGVQYADMRDEANDGGAFSGVSWTTGLRVGW